MIRTRTLALGWLGGLLGVFGFFTLLWWLNSGEHVTSKMHKDYSEVTIPYHGHPLYCVNYSRGISCDWQRWHAEAGR